MAIDERLLETKEVLERTGIKPTMLHSWLDRGIIPCWEAFRAFAGDGLRYYYPPEIVDKIKEVQALRDKGKGYREIKALLAHDGARE
ncbi:hypothetical protein ES708_22594 [subsurface metagenome]